MTLFTAVKIEHLVIAQTTNIIDMDWDANYQLDKESV